MKEPTKIDDLLDFLKPIVNLFITELSSLHRNLDTLQYLLIRSGDRFAIFQMFVLCYHLIMTRHLPPPSHFWKNSNRSC